MDKYLEQNRHLWLPAPWCSSWPSSGISPTFLREIPVCPLRDPGFLGFLTVWCSLWPQNLASLLSLLGTPSHILPHQLLLILYITSQISLPQGRLSGLLYRLSQYLVPHLQSISQGYPFISVFIFFILVSLWQRLPVLRYHFSTPENSQFSAEHKVAPKRAYVSLTAGQWNVCRSAGCPCWVPSEGKGMPSSPFPPPLAGLWAERQGQCYWDGVGCIKGRRNTGLDSLLEQNCFTSMGFPGQKNKFSMFKPILFWVSVTADDSPSATQEALWRQAAWLSWVSQHPTGT